MSELLSHITAEVAAAPLPVPNDWAGQVGVTRRQPPAGWPSPSAVRASRSLT